MAASHYAKHAIDSMCVHGLYSVNPFPLEGVSLPFGADTQVMLVYLA